MRTQLHSLSCIHSAAFTQLHSISCILLSLSPPSPGPTGTWPHSSTEDKRTNPLTTNPLSVCFAELLRRLSPATPTRMSFNHTTAHFRLEFVPDLSIGAPAVVAIGAPTVVAVDQQCHPLATRTDMAPQDPTRICGESELWCGHHVRQLVCVTGEGGCEGPPLRALGGIVGGGLGSSSFFWATGSIQGVECGSLFGGLR
jgi:hypothetical protein